jgi:hypothetical protein
MKKGLMGIIACFALFVASYVFAAPVPDTGQTKCYDIGGYGAAANVITCPSPGQALYGQDANYSINPMSYTKLDGSGNAIPVSATSWVMVKDNVTGLIWENKTDDGSIHDKGNSYTWYDPTDPNPGTPGDGTDTKDFIDALNSAKFGGYSDWRLPTIKELVSIVNHGISSPGPTIYTGYFPNTAASWSYLSSTTCANSTSEAWGVDFIHGGISRCKKGWDYSVRAVRGERSGSLDHLTIGSFDTVNSGPSDDASTATGGYTDNNDGTVTDTSTGLMWQQTDSSGSWDQALAYCEGLKLGGYTDWRLPTSKELQSLADYSRYSPAINTTYFPDAAASCYWSGTTDASFTSYAWLVYFDFGNISVFYDDEYISGSYKVRSAHVRAVRGGQSGLDPSVISVSPASRAVAKDAGTTTFSVSNTGTGTMHWTAAVTSWGGGWLSITSGASGTNSGTINCGFTANTGISARTATIRVTATTGATGSPVDVTVTQAPTTPTYTDNGDGTVTDTSIGLMWQQATAPNTYNWNQAISYCESLSFAGYTDWRLPKMDELIRLVDSRWHPTINPTYFPNTIASGYWSSDTYDDDECFADAAAARYMDFNNGGGDGYCQGYSLYVRAVRDGQSELFANLVISPASRDVAKDAGTTTFNVSNTGTGTMPWTAAVTSGGSWLSITSGASGSNSGAINCSYPTNTMASARTATIRVTATGATGSPVDVTVTQAGAESLAASFVGSGLWIYNSSSAAWSQISSTNPERVIYSGSTLYADFGASGLYKFDGAAWTQLTPSDPENIVASGSTIYVDFGVSNGLYKWDGTAWTQLTSAKPENMVATGSTLYADFGSGLYKWDGAAWAQLTPLNPENMVTSGSTLYVDFGASNGLYKWDGTSWSQLTLVNPENMVTSGTTLYVNFGASHGLYKWDGSAWTQLTSATPENMVSAGSLLYADFGALGLYKWDGAVWAQLTTANPENMVTSGSTLYVDFGALGLYKWDGTAWNQLTGSDPVIMAVSN